MSNTASLEKHVAPRDQAESTHGGNTYVPPVDIIERDDELLLVADVPGANADGININYERGELTLAARVQPRRNPETDDLLCEYGVGDYVRTFRVGEAIDASKIEAEVSNGVLTLHLPKAEAAKTRKIAVRAV